MRVALMLLCVAALAAAGCAGRVAGAAYAQPPIGFVYGNHRAPLETDFEATLKGSKHGSAKTRYIHDPFFTGLPIAAWGDASVALAADSAGISRVHYADYEVLNVLGIYREFTIHVSGE